MIGTLCEECGVKNRCQTFGITHHLASRLMIGKSVQKENEPFPIAIYLDDIESEGLNPETTLRFVDEMAPHCLYFQ
jgi:hypothetical protein